MRPHARILPALVAAVALLSYTLGEPQAGSEPLYGPILPRAASYYGPYATASSAAARPAPPTEAERLAREIARTERLIATAEGRVRRSSSENAKADFKNARARQLEAREASAQTFYARATRLTLESRAYAKSALIQVGPPENDPDVVARALAQTDDALQRVDAILDDGAAPKHRQLYESLRDRQERARLLFKNGVVRGAYAQTRVVRSGVLDLLRQCADLPVSRETARRALRRAERAVTETRKELGTKAVSRAVRLEREAGMQLDRARSSFARRSYRDALLHSKLVERHLQRAMEARRLATNQSG